MSTKSNKPAQPQPESDAPEADSPVAEAAVSATPELTNAEAMNRKRIQQAKAKEARAASQQAQAEAIAAAAQERDDEAAELAETENEAADLRNRLAVLESQMAGLRARTDAPTPAASVPRIRSTELNVAVADANAAAASEAIGTPLRKAKAHTYRVTPTGRSAKQGLPVMIVDDCADEAGAKAAYCRAANVSAGAFAADVVEVERDAPDVIIRKSRPQPPANDYASLESQLAARQDIIAEAVARGVAMALKQQAEVAKA